VPKGTKSLALILEDPDAPSGTFDHWIAWGISPEVKQIAEGAKLLHQGVNHFGKKGYGGPCPPMGEKHRYYFKLYALDVELQLPEGSSKAKLLASMKNHILEEAELIGTYQKE
jgi:Raf kinase inhibitor-like YbhB/YbcL family protein